LAGKPENVRAFETWGILLAVREKSVKEKCPKTVQ